MLWLKAFHIIFVVCWFAGLFYLPRLYVYHSEAHDSISLERFKIMERRLYYGIMAPAAILTIAFGISMLKYYPLWPMWLKIKLALVGGLVLFHLYCGKLRRDFYQNRNCHSSKFYRILNEIPTVLLIAIVILATVK